MKIWPTQDVVTHILCKIWRCFRSYLYKIWKTIPHSEELEMENKSTDAVKLLDILWCSSENLRLHEVRELFDFAAVDCVTCKNIISYEERWADISLSLCCCNQMADIKTVIRAGALLLISCERNQYILKTVGKLLDMGWWDLLWNTFRGSTVKMNGT